MATIGLKGVWVLGKLDESRFATWQLGLLLVGGGALSGAMLLSFLMLLDERIRLNTAADFVFVVPGTIGAWLFLTLYFERTTESDLGSLRLLDDAVSAELSKLRMHPIPLAVMTMLGIPVMLMTFIGPWFAVENFSLAHLLNENIATQVAFYVLIPLFGMTLGPLFCSLYLQCRCLIGVARRIEIDLYRLRHYSAIANPVVRYLVAWLFITALFPVAVIWTDDQQKAQGLMLIYLAFSGPALGIIVGYGFPVYVLRNRIRDLKDQVLSQLEAKAPPQAWAGAGEVIYSTDNLARYQFVESRWDWPIAPHVQKLFLFGLLPPVTWVLAAVVENALY